MWIWRQYLCKIQKQENMLKNKSSKNQLDEEKSVLERESRVAFMWGAHLLWHILVFGRMLPGRSGIDRVSLSVFLSCVREAARVLIFRNEGDSAFPNGFATIWKSFLASMHAYGFFIDIPGAFYANSGWEERQNTGTVGTLPCELQPRSFDFCSESVFRGKSEPFLLWHFEQRFVWPPFVTMRPSLLI